MTGRVEGKVAFITGAARGQGRSHTLTLAREGADIVALDIAEQIESVPVPMATKADLEETASLVEATGRGCLAVQADVRDIHALDGAVQDTLSRFGRLDIVLANAGVLHTSAGMGDEDLDKSARNWADAIVMLTGVYNTVRVVTQPLIDQGRGRLDRYHQFDTGLTGMQTAPAESPATAPPSTASSG